MVSLQPQLPQKDDFDIEYGMILLHRITEALQQFHGLVPNKYKSGVHFVMMTTIIALDIRAQNAGMLVRRAENSIQLEAFDLAPLNEAVMSTKGRLRRCFPGPALSLTLEQWGEPGFQATFAHAVAKMSTQATKDTQPKTRKSRQDHDEERNTTHPKVLLNSPPRMSTWSTGVWLEAAWRPVGFTKEMTNHIEVQTYTHGCCWCCKFATRPWSGVASQVAMTPIERRVPRSAGGSSEVHETLDDSLDGPTTSSNGVSFRVCTISCFRGFVYLGSAGQELTVSVELNA
ncbi:uncharacterized protein HMPREF1541_09015 [Cyphellophora europaea CBS 101466]|uniref:DUF6606 domain-containing protein n=1 Tax=Cyphellophora europaea (strain CBS 101466) TaxID=1220924 RepID=W2RJS0_CYPE1|nr:uncharacterized protein HMPREF1541_09015 [Cyphellophora europaea CBS 101466]ETN36737.1 hypothetical protein HMPREF1541_09015 [Cyphellophora europaea CBS 101466]